MDALQFRRDVMLRAHLQDETQADRLIEATLRTLAERVSEQEAHDLRVHLPDTLQPLLASGAGERFGSDEFVRRLSVRSGLDAGPASAFAAAVLVVLRDELIAGEWADLLSRLPAVPVATQPAAAPSSVAEEALAQALTNRPASARWQRDADHAAWHTVTDDGATRAELRVVEDAFEARVYRYPTRPSGARPELSHGPQVFATADEAVAYAEAHLGPAPKADQVAP